MSKKVLVITMDTERNEILDTLELTDCAAVSICPEGYVCVETPPLPTEKQQYPKGETEEFVQRVTGGHLVDIDLDDPRWKSRETGAVYGRENANCIVFYWPANGEAVFDPTRLSNPVHWYDYRTASGRDGGGSHTSLPVSVDMNVWFRDSGGGVLILQRR